MVVASEGALLVVEDQLASDQWLVAEVGATGLLLDVVVDQFASDQWLVDEVGSTGREVSDHE